MIHNYAKQIRSTLEKSDPLANVFISCQCQCPLYEISKLSSNQILTNILLRTQFI